MRYQLPHPYKTAAKITVLCKPISILEFLDGAREDGKSGNKW
jgi:hypothetical protein